MNVAVVFGGSGFIGSHFTNFLLNLDQFDIVYVADIKPLDCGRTTTKYKEYVNQGRIRYLECDVRKEITLGINEKVSLIANFAAIHREPGHELREYFETNLKGAENVCEWATSVLCRKVIFTSSIAPYGPSESELNEQSIPVPVSAYGASKLAAEKIHIAWKYSDYDNNKLVIVRPGVVFGAGEYGNVSRLIKATLKRYFIYMGNKRTRKAGVYVKELCNAMWWVLENKTDGVSPPLFNMTMNPGPQIEEYVNTVCDVADVKRYVPNVPSSLIYLMSLVIDPIAKVLKVDQPISPVRIKKLVRSNNIYPGYLTENGYEYIYDLNSAMRDWKSDKPSEWDY